MLKFVLYLVFLIALCNLNEVEPYGFPNMASYTVFPSSDGYEMFDFKWQGNYLAQGQYLLDPVEAYALVMEYSGYLTLYRLQDENAIWSVGANVSNPSYPYKDANGVPTPYYVAGLLYGDLQVGDYLTWNITYDLNLYYTDEYCMLKLNPFNYRRRGYYGVIFCIECGCDSGGNCGKIHWCAQTTWTVNFPNMGSYSLHKGYAPYQVIDSQYPFGFAETLPMGKYITSPGDNEYVLVMEYSGYATLYSMKYNKILWQKGGPISNPNATYSLEVHNGDLQIGDQNLGILTFDANHYNKDANGNPVPNCALILDPSYLASFGAKNAFCVLCGCNVGYPSVACSSISWCPDLMS